MTAVTSPAPDVPIGAVDPGVPDNERRRLSELERLNILDTLPEQEFDDITRIASALCGTPIALISLVDDRRQWFKSNLGLDAPETPREMAFCAHAIMHGKREFVVTDAAKDPRFSGNPLVTGDPNIRFYAGVPLTNEDGLSYGTLCVIDREPRALYPDQHEALRALARQVMQLLELRRNRIELEERDEELSRFASVAAHDLKSPLRAIHTTADWLQQDLSEHFTEETKRTMDKLRGCVRHMSRFVDDLLLYARAGHAAEDVKPERASGRQVLDGAVEMLEVLAEIGAVRRDCLRGQARQHHAGKHQQHRNPAHALA